MVGDFKFLLPLFLCAAVAYGIAWFFQPGSAYTFVFAGMGIRFAPGTFTEETKESTKK